MSLVSSGILHLKGSSAEPTRSIQNESEESYIGDFSLVEAAEAAGDCVGSLPVSITDFYDWTNEVPAVPGSCTAQEAPLSPGIIEVFWTATNSPVGDNVRVQYTLDTGITYWLPVSGQEESLMVGGTQFPGPLPASHYKCRVWSENCNGISSYRESSRFEVIG